MTTTQGRLLVTCVGGFACTEWELHNWPNTERVFGSAQQFELRMKFMNLVMEQSQSMCRKMVRWLRFFSSRPSSVILTHYIIPVDLATAPNPEILSCAWSSQLASERRKKRNVFDMSLLMRASWHPLTDPKPPVFLPKGENPTILCGEAPGPRQAKHLIAWQIFPVELTCFVSPHSRDPG